MDFMGEKKKKKKKLLEVLLEEMCLLFCPPSSFAYNPCIISINYKGARIILQTFAEVLKMVLHFLEAELRLLHIFFIYFSLQMLFLFLDKPVI